MSSWFPFFCSLSHTHTNSLCLSKGIPRKWLCWWLSVWTHNNMCMPSPCLSFVCSICCFPLKSTNEICRMNGEREREGDILLREEWCGGRWETRKMRVFGDYMSKMLCHQYHKMRPWLRWYKFDLQSLGVSIPQIKSIGTVSDSGLKRVGSVKLSKTQNTFWNDLFTCIKRAVPASILSAVIHHIF